MTLSRPRFAVLVLVASLLGLMLAAWSGYENRRLAEGTRRLAECQSRYNEVNNERTRALAAAADEERTAERRADAAERALFTDPVLSTPADRRSPADTARINQLFADYQHALTALELERAEADKARTEHPVPPPPSQTCAS